MAYRDVVLTDLPFIYYRMDNNVNANVIFTIQDISGHALNYTASINSSNYSNAASLLYGDSNPAIQTAAGLGNRASGTPATGNGVWSIECLFQFSSNPGSNHTLIGFCNTTCRTSGNLTLTTTGQIHV